MNSLRMWGNFQKVSVTLQAGEWEKKFSKKNLRIYTLFARTIVHQALNEATRIFTANEQRASSYQNFPPVKPAVALNIHHIPRACMPI